jgi:hypothetical protein
MSLCGALFCEGFGCQNKPNCPAKVSHKPHGCICPPTAEQTCQGPLCPRKPVGKPA